MRKFSDYIIQDISLTRKVMLLTLSLIAIPLIIIGCLYYINVKSIIGSEVRTTYEYMVEQYVKEVNYKTNLYSNLITAITLSDSVQEALLKNSSEDYFSGIAGNVKVTSTIALLGLNNNYSEIDDIGVYYLNEGINIESKYMRNLTETDHQTWFKNIEMKQRRLQWSSENVKDNTITLYKPISSIGNEKRLDLIGLLKIKLNKKTIFQAADNTMGEINNLVLYITDQSGELIFTTGHTDMITRKRADGMVIERPINFMGWNAFFVFPMQSIKTKIVKTVFLAILSIILFGIIIITLIYHFTQIYVKRIRKLITKMKEVKNGSLQIDMVISGKDEIGIVDIHFNDMVAKLQESINENYLQKLARQEAELKALQFQINPHFLFNTLECIHSMALVHNCPDISDVSLKLGDMMRYNINIGLNEYVTLGEEMQQIENYIAIQKIRFGNRFEYFLDVPEELLESRMLKFIIQPLVENVIQHGLLKKHEQGIVEIIIWEQDDLIQIRIQDNGIGILTERLTMIKDKLISLEELNPLDNKRSIGMQNVNTRIKLAYGNAYGLEIESTPAVWTRVTIRIPKK